MRRLRLVMLLSVSCPHPSTAFAEPAHVLIIRHGEKPETGSPHLSEKGVERARALKELFDSHPKLKGLGKPAAIYAAEQRHEESSMRFEETVRPLAEKLGLKVDTGFDKKRVKKLAREILGRKDLEGKTVLICWQHDLIPEVAKRLGARKVPKRWPRGAYDRVWKISFRGEGAPELVDLPMRLLPGDSAD